ncbi:anti-sigma-K factor RskA [Pedobacter cryoconitis]|uniref:Anti-sigma-K factor RskA n=1 Tax=Pedobacter cryoconitis TaxID=188932 RepID=A0A7W8YQF4_9SPHI|nr:anti-sigma factor [Pedobacter cryoconitis]MBB5619916.1 anti-sigma-K factor RskA [Pedobacter cryoconitis]
MEEAKAYIETGILELYVLGHLNAQEQREVEGMAAKYPAIKEEITAIEIAMEQYAIKHAIEPTSGLDKQIFEKIGIPVNEVPVSGKTTSTPVHEAKIVPLPADHAASTIRTLRYSLVACIGLLVVSVAALYATHDKLNVANQQIIAMNIDKEKFASTVSFMKDENKDLQEIAAISADPSWTSVKLAGTKISPQANMMVYWHKKGQHVMVDNTKMALPQNDAAHQYQLWAIVDGKPVDLGVFDAKSGPGKLLLTMKEVGHAQAFAVTLEKRGGSPSPTMEKMIAMGGVSI